MIYYKFVTPRKTKLNTKIVVTPLNFPIYYGYTRFALKLVNILFEPFNQNRYIRIQILWPKERQRRTKRSSRSISNYSLLEQD